MDFLVERSPREVLNRVGVHLLRQGFGMPEGGHSDTTMLFTRAHAAQHKGLLRKLLLSDFLDTTLSSLQRVRLVVSEVGERRTRLKIIDSSEGECPDIQEELAQWVIEKLGATYYRPVGVSEDNQKREPAP